MESKKPLPKRNRCEICRCKKHNFVDLHDDLVGRLRDLRDELNAMVEDILDAREEVDGSD